MEVLNELYLGRGPVEPLRSQLSIIRKKLVGKQITPSTNLDSDILKFNRLAESIFGFHSFSLCIQPDHELNAYALSMDNFLTEEEKYNIVKSLAASPTGFKYTSAFTNVSFIMAVNIGMFELKEITDDEIMAAILHEIGHSFFVAVTTPDNSHTACRKLSSMIIAMNKFAIDKVKKGKAVTEEIVDKEMSIFSKAITGIKKSFAKFKKKVFNESMHDNMKKSRINYTNEKFADTFAAMYGYGEAINSFNTKALDIQIKNYGIKPKKRPRIVEIMEMYNMYLNDLIAYVLNMQDEHPETLARVKTTADYLKKEISREGIDPVIKKELVEELNKVNEIIEQYRNYPKDQDSIRIIRLYQNKLYEKFGGDRREKDTDNDALFDFIDSKYKNLSK